MVTMAHRHSASKTSAKSAKNEPHLTTRSRRTRAHRGHDILDSMIEASIELGMRDYGDTLQLYRWGDILEHPRTPEAVKFSTDPFRITLADGSHVIPDGAPLVLRHNLNGALALFRETDRATEDLSGNARITIEKKLLNWKQAIEGKLYEKIYGFPSAMLLFITIDERRMERIMRLTERTLGPCSYILFKTTQDYEQSFKSVKPHTDILTMPFKRVGFPSFSLLTLSSIEKGPRI